jgi:formylglycine-generating enzyme required for sulfatase activity
VRIAHCLCDRPGGGRRRWKWPQWYIHETSVALICCRNCPFEWKDAAVDDGYRSTAPVGSYEAGQSPYGAYDMAGNVWEWVPDWDEATYYRRSSARHPQGPTSGTQVVLRGGSWLYASPDLRATERAGVPPGRSNENIGLRCVQAP